jgi:hypothetical protein
MTFKELVIGIIVFVLTTTMCYATVSLIELNFKYNEWNMFSRYFFTIFCIIIAFRIPSTIDDIQRGS